MGACFKSYSSYKSDQPETIHVRAKINLASHPVQTLSRNYFAPWHYLAGEDLCILS